MPKRRGRNNSDDSFYKKKHKRLDTIALITKNLAWMALVTGVLVVIGDYVQQKNYLEFQMITMSFQQGTDVTTFLKERPVFSLSLIIDMFNTLLKSVIYAAVLKGISLGLYMLIEIDLNYSLISDDEME